MTKVIDSVDFGPGIPCTHDSDLNELMRTIYAYFCYKAIRQIYKQTLTRLSRFFPRETVLLLISNVS